MPAELGKGGGGSLRDTPALVLTLAPRLDGAHVSLSYPTGPERIALSFRWVDRDLHGELEKIVHEAARDGD